MKPRARRRREVICSGRSFLRDYLRLHYAGWVAVSGGDGQICMVKPAGAKPIKHLVFVEQRAKA